MPASSLGVQVVTQDADRHRRKQGDPADQECLHERERRLRERTDADRPPGDPEDAADEPQPGAQQRAERPHGVPDGDRGRGNRAGMLNQVARVEGDRPDEREREAGEEVVHALVDVMGATMPI